MSTAYSQHIHIVLFKTTLHSILALLFIYAFLFTMWYFSTMTAQLTLHQCLQHILNIYIRFCLQLHYPVHWLCYLYMLPLHNVIFFHNYCTIDSTTMSTAYPPHIHIVLFYNYSPMYTGFAVYICFPFHNVIFFHNDCTINSTPMFTAYPQHIHTVFVYNYTTQYTDFAVYICCPFHNVIFFHNHCPIFFLFTIWYFFTITVQFTLQQCL